MCLTSILVDSTIVTDIAKLFRVLFVGLLSRLLEDYMSSKENVVSSGSCVTRIYFL